MFLDVLCSCVFSRKDKTQCQVEMSHMDSQALMETSGLVMVIVMAGCERQVWERDRRECDNVGGTALKLHSIKNL